MISRVNHHQKMSFSKCMSGDIFLLILLVAADQGAKWLSYLYLKGQPSVSLIPGVLELHYLYPENRGIAFGMFQGSVLFFAIVSVLFLGVILYAWIRIPKERLSAVAHHCYSTCSWCTGKFYRSFFQRICDRFYLFLPDRFSGI